MSHDIRTPMNAIIGFTTLASANTGNEEKIKEYLSKILSSSQHLLSLINDVLVSTIGIWRDDNQSYSIENIILSHKRGVYKYGY